MFGDNSLSTLSSKLQDVIKNDGNEVKSQIGVSEGDKSIAVDASIVIQGNVDGDTWKKIYPVLKQHQDKVAEIVNKSTAATFNKRGVAVY